MPIDFVRNALRKRRSFDDGSFIEYLDRESLLYVDTDGHRMAVNWWFGGGLDHGRILYEADIDSWLPPDQETIVSDEERREIVQKIADYCEKRDVKLRVRPGTSRLDESALADLRGVIEFSDDSPAWLTPHPEIVRRGEFADGSVIEWISGNRVQYSEADGHRLILNWTFVARDENRVRIRIHDSDRWEQPFHDEPMSASKLEDIREKLATSLYR